MPRTPHDLVLFDLDGTLTDPAAGICRSINHALTSHGFDAQPDAELTRYIGPPIDQTFATLTGAGDPLAIESMVARYRERYGDVGFAENRVYPGVPETLSALAEAGVGMAVCTSKRVDFAIKVLDLFDLRRFFDFVHGGDVGIDKTMQLTSLREQGRVGAKSLMIGDRGVDLSAARRNGLFAGGVIWGYGSREELVAERPDYLFESCHEWVSLAEDASP
ncbi:MAG TPA: HAD hydrolase-like protein [Actinomycetota bacterium]|nr:HAD hydrolase-like protein [Actinomycetota bacterium]